MNEYQRYEENLQQNNIAGSVPTNAGTAVKFLLIGMGIGAAVALLVTPASGRQVRNSIGRGFRNAFDGISEQTRNLRDRGSNLLGFNRRKTATGELEQGTGI